MSSMSSCTTHPTTEAVGRCKQCGRPFCGKCRVVGPSGNFCSDACQKNHETFVARAQQLDDMKKKTPIAIRIRQLLILAAVAFVGGGVAHYMGIDVPILSDSLGGMLPRR